MRVLRRTGLPISRALVASTFVFLSAHAAFSQTPGALPHAWSEAVYALAQKAAAALGPVRTFSVEAKDVSAAAPVGLADVQRAFEQDMLARGMRPVAAPGDAQVQVAISQSLAGFVLVAEIRRADAEQVAIIPVASEESQSGQPPVQPGLQRKIVWQQAQPILDFDVIDAGADGTFWYFLEPERLAVYQFDAGQQLLRQAQPIPRRFATRDLRGWIQATDATHLTAFIGGTRCEASWSPSLAVDCRENNGQQWPAPRGSWTFTPGRNYFSGAVTLSESLQTKFPPFYSSASPVETSGQGPSRRVIAGVDGEAQFFEGGAGAVASFDGWGSETISVTNACGPAWQVLATGAGDWTEKDQIQLYEIRDRKAVAIGQPVELPGPTVALWPADDGKSARVISRNLETGLYEASLVSVSCGN